MKTIIIFLVLLSMIDAKLLFVSETYRHGARGPLNSFYDAKN